MAELHHDDPPIGVPVPLEVLRAALDENARLVRAVYIAFLSFCLYVLIIAGSTTHEELLRNKARKIPFVEIDLPVTSIYFIVPILILLFHFTLLLQLHFLAEATWRYRRRLVETPGLTYEQYVDNIHAINSSPFIYMLIGENLNPMMKLAVRVIMGFSILIGPSLILMYALGAFLPFHHELIGDMYIFSILFDLAISILFWWIFFNGRAFYSNISITHKTIFCISIAVIIIYISILILSILISGLFYFLSVAILLTISVSTVRSHYMLVAQVLYSLCIFGLITFGSYRPFGGIGDQFYSGFDGRSFRWSAEASLPHLHHQVLEVSLPSVWWELGRVLGELMYSFGGMGASSISEDRLQINLPEGTVDDINIIPKLLMQIRAPIRTIEFHGLLHDIDFAEVYNEGGRERNVKRMNIGVDLSDRDLRGANFSRANLSKVIFSSSNISMSILMGAILDEAVFTSNERVITGRMAARRTNLHGANLLATSLYKANMQAVDLSGTDLRAAKFIEADLTMAYIHWALAAANFSGANLLASDLSASDFSGADIKTAFVESAKAHLLIFGEYQIFDVDGFKDLERKNDNNYKYSKLFPNCFLSFSGLMSDNYKKAICDNLGRDYKYMNEKDVMAEMENLLFSLDSNTCKSTIVFGSAVGRIFYPNFIFGGKRLDDAFNNSFIKRNYIGDHHGIYRMYSMVDKIQNLKKGECPAAKKMRYKFSLELLRAVEEWKKGGRHINTRIQ